MKSQLLPVPPAARLRRLLASPKLREIALFLTIGGTSAILYIIMNVIWTQLGLAPTLCILLTVGILLPPTYYLQHRLTFRSTRDHISAFPRYAAAQLLGNVLALVVAQLFPEPIRAHPFVAWFLIGAMVAGVNYGIVKFWAFRSAGTGAVDRHA